MLWHAYFLTSCVSNWRWYIDYLDGRFQDIVWLTEAIYIGDGFLIDLVVGSAYVYTVDFA
jgi:hypothetical protein